MVDIWLTQQPPVPVLVVGGPEWILVHALVSLQEHEGQTILRGDENNSQKHVEFRGTYNTVFFIFNIYICMYLFDCTGLSCSTRGVF